MTASNVEQHPKGFEYMNRSELLQVLKAVGKQQGGAGYIAVAMQGLSTQKRESISPPGNDHDSVRSTDFPESNSSKKSARRFDFDRFGTRHIALQVSYTGAKYHGYASQGGDEKTVEKELLDALMKVKLIKDRVWACYSRCARTDRGVSALCQVVGLRVRSSIVLPPTSASDEKVQVESNSRDVQLLNGETEDGQVEGAVQEEDASQAVADIWSQSYETSVEGEMDYCAMLNHTLPPDIRVLGWAPGPPGFTARFCATSRTYRYFFDAAGMDLGLMQEAAHKLQGNHDYRNFCKVNATGTHSFFRWVQEARIHRPTSWQWVMSTDNHAPSLDLAKAQVPDICFLEIRAQAFLWHMVRNIMTILSLVGRRLEPPNIVDTLLDIGACPAKPSYAPAPELSLVLHDCAFNHLRFTRSVPVLHRLWKELRVALSEAVVKVGMLSNQLEYAAGLRVDTREVLDYVAARREGGSKGRKRRRIESSEQAAVEESDDTTCAHAKMSWRAALTEIELKTSELVCEAETNRGGRYVPIMQRAMGKKYDQLVKELGQRKRQLYEESRRKKEAAQRQGHADEIMQRLRG